MLQFSKLVKLINNVCVQRAKECKTLFVDHFCLVGALALHSFLNFNHALSFSKSSKFNVRPNYFCSVSFLYLTF